MAATTQPLEPPVIIRKANNNTQAQTKPPSYRSYTRSHSSAGSMSRRLLRFHSRRKFSNALWLIMIIVVAFTTDRLLTAVVRSTYVNSEAETSLVQPTILPEETLRLRKLQPLGNRTVGKPVLPNVLLIGAPNAGSDAIADWLFTMGVCGPETDPEEPDGYSKEVHFFDKEDRWAKGKDFYKQRYAHCFTKKKKWKFRMDATPTTLLHPQRVYDVYKSVRNIQKLRIIVTLREPVAREMTLYNHQLSLFERQPNMSEWYANVMNPDGETPKTFGEFVDTVTIPSLNRSSSLSHYAQHLQPWFQLFDPQQILVLSYETDIAGDTDDESAQRRIRHFLEYKSKVPSYYRDPPLATDADLSPPCSVAERLQPLFAQRNQELYDLLSQHPRHGSERQPFPPFPPDCQPDNLHVYLEAINEMSERKE